jgi:hypothetical protein
MSAAPQKTKGSAEAATSPSRGSIIPAKETTMNKTEHSIRPAVVPALSRRNFLASAAAVTLPSVVLTASEPTIKTAKERAEHHLDELRAALEETFNKPFRAEIMWDVEAAVLFGRTERT